MFLKNIIFLSLETDLYLMEAFLNYFETFPALHRGLIIVGGLTFFWLLEGAMPLFNFKYKKWKHAIPNIFFTLTTVLVNLPMAFLLLWTADWTLANNFGILNWLPEMTLGVYIFLGVLFMDFFWSLFTTSNRA